MQTFCNQKKLAENMHMNRCVFFKVPVHHTVDRSYQLVTVRYSDGFRNPSFLQDGLRPVIYYCQHLMQDMNEEKTFSRALISFVKYDNPKTIMHPMLIFVLDLLWDQLVPWPR